MAARADITIEKGADMKCGLVRLGVRMSWAVVKIGQRGIRRAELDEEREPEPFTASHNRVLRRMKRWGRVEAFGRALEGFVDTLAQKAGCDMNELLAPL
jgi:hypothetical protein